MRDAIKPAIEATMLRKQGTLARWRRAMQAEWKAFTASAPGERFQDRYHRKRDSDRPTWKKIAAPVLGILIVALGLILLPAPGPGIPVVLFGLALVAEHFLCMARLLDRCEPPIRSMVTVLSRKWQHAAPPYRWAVGVAVVLMVLAAVAALLLLLT